MFGQKDIITALEFIAQFLQAVKLVLYKAGTMYFILKNIALKKIRKLTLHLPSVEKSSVVFIFESLSQP